MKIKFIAFLFTALLSCATPKAIDVVQIGDNEMSCNELKLAYESANYHEDFAHQNKGVTDENILSGFSFPAYFVTYGTSIHAEQCLTEKRPSSETLFKKGMWEGRDAQYQAKISQKLEELEDLKDLCERKD